MTDKDRLRRLVREARRLEPEAARRQRAQLLLATADQVRVRAAGGIAGFQPTNHEPDIGPLLSALAAAAIPVFLPRVVPGHELEWVPAAVSDLSGTRTGIPVPAGAAIGGPDALMAAGVGLILVPALAIDPDTGARLGYGAGYYDRLLPRLPGAVLVVGVCRDADLFPVPTEPHDVAMGALLTESGLRLIAPHG